MSHSAWDVHFAVEQILADKALHSGDPVDTRRRDNSSRSVPRGYGKHGRQGVSPDFNR
jgi:hypothetical protein